MSVLVVARTRAGKQVCVGGLDLASTASLRLVQKDWDFLPSDTPYEVGDVWELDVVPSARIRPPHVEDVVVRSGKLVKKEAKVRDLLLETIRPWKCPFTSVFEGRLRWERPAGRSLYLARGSALPGRSSWFWFADCRLTYDGERYDVPSAKPSRLHAKYVGEGPAIPVIPRGTLVRLSLARWWRPDPEADERCYLQISGWYP